LYGNGAKALPLGAAELKRNFRQVYPSAIPAADADNGGLMLVTSIILSIVLSVVGTILLNLFLRMFTRGQ
jgi:hypothetical protein